MNCSDISLRGSVVYCSVSILQSTAHADPTISTSTPTPCYGDVVTLVCHHPEVASNPERYFSQPTAWEENGVEITPIPGTMFTDEIAKDRKSSTLNINITVDHFKNKSFNYSCLLVLAKNGLPSSEVERSENVTIDPVGEWVVYVCMYVVGACSTHTIILCISTYVCMYLIHYPSSMSIAHTNIGLCTLPHTQLHVHIITDTIFQTFTRMYIHTVHSTSTAQVHTRFFTGLHRTYHCLCVCVIAHTQYLMPVV